jgi:hypothetical protein
MFKEKAMITTPKKEDVVINMVLAITTHSQIPEMWYLKKKSLSRTKVWPIGKKRKSFNVEGAIKDIQQKESLKDLYGANIQTLV